MSLKSLETNDNKNWRKKATNNVNVSALSPFTHWISADRYQTYDIAWGDIDGDGDLDLAVGNKSQGNSIYLNDDGELQTVPSWTSFESDRTTSIAWGDVDGDGDLDLAVGNGSARLTDDHDERIGSANKLYINENGRLSTFAELISSDLDDTQSVAWGDVDADGDLDLAVGNYNGANKLYLNVNGQLQPTAVWVSNDDDHTLSVAWGDIEGDGDLDLAVGNDRSDSKVYLNHGGMLELDASWESKDNDTTWHVAWGDMNSDGYPELATAVSNDYDEQCGCYWGETNKVYFNENGTLSTTGDSPWESNEADVSMTVAWGDVDGDGDLDLAFGDQNRGNKIHLNDSGNLSIQANWESDGADNTQSIAFGDVDGDGDLELATGNKLGDHNKIYLNLSSVLQRDADLARISHDDDITYAIDLGDVDGDGDLDLAVANQVLQPNDERNKVYINEDGTFSSRESWESTESDVTNDLMWGDVDNDGDLDLAVANGDWTDLIEGGESNRLYINHEGALLVHPTWSSNEEDVSMALAWGDVDNDGDLDLAVGNRPLSTASENYSPMSGANKLYLNVNGNLEFGAVWVSEDFDSTDALAWGDVDQDGDLDLAVANIFAPDKVYINHGGLLEATASWETADSSATRSLAWGDVDGDGDLDLATGDQETNKIYFNENGVLQTTHGWVSRDGALTWDVTWGDVDGDGDLDLAAGGADTSRLYLNFDGELQTAADVSLVIGSELDDIRSFAWGDIDNDGDLDLVGGNRSGPNRVYVNRSHGFAVASFRETSLTVSTPVTAALAVSAIPSQFLTTTVITIPYRYSDLGGRSAGQIAGQYSLDGGRSWRTAVAQNNTTHIESDIGPTNGLVAWWSFDEGRGREARNRIIGSPDARVIGGNSLRSRDVPLALTNMSQYAMELDGSDYLAINDSPLINQGEFFERSVSVWFVVDDKDDNRPQVIYEEGGSENGLNLYIRDGRLYAGGYTDEGPWNEPYMSTASINNGQWHHAVLTLAGNNIYGSLEPDVFQLYLDGYLVDSGWGTGLGFHGSDTGLGGVNDETLFDDTSGYGVPVNGYALRGKIDDARIYNRALTQEEIQELAQPQATHYFEWDTFASGFFGQSNHVMFRITASLQPPTSTMGVPGTYQYFNSQPFPIQRPTISATSFPFRVRGTQVRVNNESGTPAQNAIVYQLRKDDSIADVMRVNEFQPPFRTDQNGYLQGRGRLDLDDRLVALYPIVTNAEYTIYHTSVAPSQSDLVGNIVNEPGVQTLTISEDNVLILYNLVVSLEWDARNDRAFMDRLERDLRIASRYLYDLTNGQVALGRVHIYHEKGYWNHADVIVRASNQSWPSAVLGGSVFTPTTVTISPTFDGDRFFSGPVTSTYLPGQVSMPAQWNRFGNSSVNIGEDWPRTLVHELGHYLFFLPDHYLGLNADRNKIILVDGCKSPMNNPYEESHSEFIHDSPWLPDCEDTLQHQFFGRSDWGMITLADVFSPLKAPVVTFDGPPTLPLAVTQIETFAENERSNVLSDNLFEVVDTQGIPLYMPSGQASAFLIKTQGTSDLTDDDVIPLGSPVGDQLLARGASVGDRVCLFAISQSPSRVGCTDVGRFAGELQLHETEEWKPQISIEPVLVETSAVSTTTVRVNVVIPNLPVTTTITPTMTIVTPTVHAQLLPAIGPASESTELIKENGRWTAVVMAPDGALYGHVRVWVEGMTPAREILIEFFNSEGWETLEWGGKGLAWGGKGLAWGGKGLAWGGKGLAWGGKGLAWGGKGLAWGAPTISGNGQLSIYPLDSLFNAEQAYIVKSLTTIPQLPGWFTPIGQAFEISRVGESRLTSSLLFRYVGTNVPEGYEIPENLFVVYSPDDGANWHVLDTDVDIERNHAAALVEGEGIYILVATIATISLRANDYNDFPYFIRDTRPVTDVLASIEGAYSSVYHFNIEEGVWELYEPTIRHPFASLVNTLESMQYGHNYKIYATAEVLPYLGITSVNRRSPQSFTDEPPATLYGWVDSEVGSIGDPVSAYIDGRLCGQSHVVAINGQLGYHLQVVAAPYNASEQCGWPGRPTEIRVGESIVRTAVAWDNTKANFVSLQRPLPLFLPLITRP